MYKRTYLILIIVMAFLLNACSTVVDNNTKNNPTTQKNTTLNTKVRTTEKNLDTSAAQDLEYLKKGYASKKFGFNVDYPEEWKSQIMPTWEATKEHNESQEEGITFYLDGKESETLTVYGQAGTINPGFSPYEEIQKDEFITKSGLKGHFESVKHDDGIIYIYLVLDSVSPSYKNIGASIIMDYGVYKEHEKEIMSVLRTIRVFEGR